MPLTSSLSSPSPRDTTWAAPWAEGAASPRRASSMVAPPPSPPPPKASAPVATPIATRATQAATATDGRSQARRGLIGAVGSTGGGTGRVAAADDSTDRGPTPRMTPEPDPRRNDVSSRSIRTRRSSLIAAACA